MTPKTRKAIIQSMQAELTEAILRLRNIQTEANYSTLCLKTIIQNLQTIEKSEPK